MTQSEGSTTSVALHGEIEGTGTDGTTYIASFVETFTVTNSKESEEVILNRTCQSFGWAYFALAISLIYASTILQILWLKMLLMFQ